MENYLLYVNKWELYFISCGEVWRTTSTMKTSVVMSVGSLEYKQGILEVETKEWRPSFYFRNMSKKTWMGSLIMKLQINYIYLSVSTSCVSRKKGISNTSQQSHGGWWRGMRRMTPVKVKFCVWFAGL